MTSANIRLEQPHSFDPRQDDTGECVYCGRDRGDKLHFPNKDDKADVNPVEDVPAPPPLNMLPPTETLTQRAARREQENRMRMSWQMEPHAYEESFGSDEDPCDTPCTKCGLQVEADVHHGQRKTDKLPDSGLRESLGEGMAKREADPTKPLLGSISPFAELALGDLLRKADIKYADIGGCRNWEDGMPMSRIIDAIKRHVNAFQRRDETEDHLAAIMWNAMCAIHFRDGGTRSGVTWDKLDDRPRWFKEPK